MKTFFGVLLAALLTTLLLAACGSPDEGPALGAFEPITKTETDEPFTLTAPSSRSPGAFTFTSSNDKVATIDGARVTIRGAGQSTITASQPRTGSFGPTEKSTTLTVTAVACDAGQVRIAGVCKRCVSPATVNAAANSCVAPTTSATIAVSGKLNFMGVTFAAVHADARDFCANSTINGDSGWRLPSVAELTALYGSGAIAGLNWTLENTWTDTLDTDVASAAHRVVHLGTGAVGARADTSPTYVTCVR